MNDTELNAIEHRFKQDVARGGFEDDGRKGLALVAEVRRLRDLIGSTACRDLCPWCQAELWIQLRTDDSSRTINGSHFADCPAFTPDGTVR